jgi:hypothetical protein
MATFSKIPLSQSTNGKSILLSLSASPGILLHTTGTSVADVDEVYIYASNNTTYDTGITLFWGSSAVSHNIMNLSINAYAGITTVVPGLILRGDGSIGSPIYAYVTNPSAVNITGYINRITA